MEKITIAIDGYSSTGKSTVARQLAEELGYIYVDTGAMYRAVTLYAINKGYIGDTFFDKKSLIDDIDAIKLSFVCNVGTGLSEIHLNGKNIASEIRTLKVSNFVSQVAAVSEVRRKLVAEQQQMGKDKGVVMDGRDIGTVVFPDADLKLFMTSAIVTRAQRRYDELTAKGQYVTLEKVTQNLQERDHIDSTREDSPLMQADDAIVFDNTEIGMDAQLVKLLSLVHKTIQKQ